MARNFSGNGWQQAHKDHAFIRNTYRVLLTRARYETIIWIPPGSPAGDPFHDRTRPAAEMDAIAAHLLACGARPLNSLQPRPGATPDLLTALGNTVPA
ncbi:DNA/RNA helicase domain-containing protein [Siccirubricoccus deserti]